MTRGMKAFLADYEARGKGHPVPRFCDLVGRAKQTYWNWRQLSDEFKRRIDELEEINLSSLPEIDRVVDGLETWQVIWLDTYSTTIDRQKACQQVSKRLDDVLESMRENPRFKREYDALRRELIARAQDTMFREAANGHVASAKQVLQAYDPDYATRVTHKHEGSIYVKGNSNKAAETWSQVFGQLSRRKPKALMAGTEDVVDGEVVSRPA